MTNDKVEMEREEKEIRKQKNPFNAVLYAGSLVVVVICMALAVLINTMA